MISIGVQKALLLHQLMIEQTGGELGVRDIGLLESALAACDATFDGKELFPSKQFFPVKRSVTGGKELF